MTLNKIINVSNVGRFINCNNIEFSNFTIIYGENGCGKSTLSAIMRSLASQKSELIDERSTLGNAKQPRVKLLVDGKVVSYEKGQWNGQAPILEVFDDIFVSENIYAAHEITSDHHTGLYEFAIGSLAVGLRTKERDFDQKIKTIDEKLNKTKKFINSNISLDFDTFIKLESDDNVSEKISKLENQIRSSQSNELIQQKEILKPLEKAQIDLTTYQDLLDKTLDNISADAESAITEHLKLHMQNNQKAEQWVESGLQFSNNETCPFCGQSTTNVDIVHLYQDYFNESYRLLKKEIESLLSNTDELLSNSKLLLIEQTRSSNQELLNFWNRHTNTSDLTFDFKSMKSSWELLNNSLTNLLKQKRNSPLDRVDFPIDDMQKHKNLIHKLIDTYNEQLTTINLSILQFKTTIENSNRNELEEQLSKLKHVQKRFDTLKDSCDEYNKLAIQRSKFDSDRKKVKKQLDNENKKILLQYQSDINHYLKSFGVDFSIEKSVDRRSRGKPRLMLQAVINGHQVNISKSQDGQPNFKNTLSTGDKTTLALAFFFAKLKQMKTATLKDTIIILDDPITSLGMHRREKTLYEIVKLIEQVKQIVVLSHEPYFLKSLFDQSTYTSKKQGLKPNLIQLTPNGNQTDFIVWNMQETLKRRYLRHCETLSNFIDNGVGGDQVKLEQIKGSIRIVLETALENRFPIELSSQDPLGTHISHIMNCASTSPLNILKNKDSLMQSLNELNQFSQPVHHSEGNQQIINERQLGSYAEETLRFIHGELG